MGRRFNILRGGSRTGQLDMYSSSGRYVQTVHWDKYDENDIVVEDSSGWTQPLQDEYKALLEVVSEKPSRAIQNAQNNLIFYLKGNNPDTRNTWAKLCMFLPLMSGMPVAADSLFWWNNPARKAVLSATPPTYKIGQGFIGNEVSSYVDTDWNASEDNGGKYTQNAATFGMYVSNDRKTANVACRNGVIDGENNGTAVYLKFDTATYCKVQGGNFNINSTNDTTNRIFTFVRENATQAQAYSDKISSGLITSNSTALINGNFYLGALNNNGVVGFYNKDCHGMFFAGSNFDATDIKTLNDAVQNLLDILCDNINVSGTITVGAGKDYVTISEAHANAISGNTIVIDAGTYNEPLKLTGKKITVRGSGNIETIIHYTIEDISKYSTIEVSQDCTFDNILFDKREYSGVVKPIVNISACNPVFVNCQIGRDIYTDGYNSQHPMSIANGSVVNMINCSITTMGTESNADLLVKDTSKLFFEGTSLHACVRLQDTAKAVIDVDYLWTAGTDDDALGVIVENDSEATVVINIREKAWNWETKAEQAPGAYTGTVGSFRMRDNGKLTLSGNQITGCINIAATGSGVNVLFKNIVSTLGRFWLYITEGALNAVATFDNCQIKHDCNSNFSYPSGPPGQGGSHIIEAYNYDGQINIINGCVLEFMANSGLYHSAGNPIESCGKLVIRDSEIIDNVNETDSYGIAYKFTVGVYEKFDFENVILTNQNWDGLAPNWNLMIKKRTGKHINGRLKNITFNNSEINEVAINQIMDIIYDELDYICESECTYNTAGLRFNDYWGGGDAAFAILKANCPD